MEKLIRDQLEKAINEKIEPVIKENQILKENNDNSNKDDNENSEYNKEKKKPPISYNKLYEFTGFNIKIFKLINRSSKKNTISFQV